jgi:hypothetical protein
MWRGIAIGSCLGLLLVAAVSAQPQRSPATLDDLLTELRGLRTDLNASAGTATRAQVIVGRLQVQEQRIASVTRELVEVQDQVRAAMQQRERTSGMVAAMKQRMESGAVVLDRVSYSRDIAEVESRLLRERQREDDLRYRENELLNMLVTEQGRWIEFSSRLDELERALVISR